MNNIDSLCKVSGRIIQEPCKYKWAAAAAAGLLQSGGGQQDNFFVDGFLARGGGGGGQLGDTFESGLRSE